MQGHLATARLNHSHRQILDPGLIPKRCSISKHRVDSSLLSFRLGWDCESSKLSMFSYRQPYMEELNLCGTFRPSWPKVNSAYRYLEIKCVTYGLFYFLCVVFSFTAYGPIVTPHHRVGPHNAPNPKTHSFSPLPLHIR